MKTSIIGCAYFNDYQVLKWKLDELKVTQIITCGKNNIEKLAARYAEENDIALIDLWPERREGWFYICREYVKLIENCEVLMAFWYGENTIISVIINKAKRMGKPVIIIRGFHSGANIPKGILN